MADIDSLNYEDLLTLLTLHNRHKKETQKNTVKDFECTKYLQKEKKKVHLELL